MDQLVRDRIMLTNLIVNQFMLKKGIDPEEYTHEIFFEDYVTRNSIAVVDRIPMIEAEFFLGVTVRSQRSTAIFLNQNATINRIRFSKCHELSHCLFDMNYRLPTQQFFNAGRKDNFYTEDEKVTESLANAAAGIIMTPDIKIVKFLHTEISFYRFAEMCRMSQAALYYRLIEFCVYSADMDEISAVRCVKKLQDTKDRYHIRSYLSGWGSTKEKEIVSDFENALG
ncbi:ImmA/IrrE family metallo-endopeptidase [Enterococcus songbeiensis]